jgi:hypothetical protein
VLTGETYLLIFHSPASKSICCFLCCCCCLSSLSKRGQQKSQEIQIDVSCGRIVEIGPGRITNKNIFSQKRQRATDREEETKQREEEGGGGLSGRRAREIATMTVSYSSKEHTLCHLPPPLPPQGDCHHLAAIDLQCRVSLWHSC